MNSQVVISRAVLITVVAATFFSLYRFDLLDPNVLGGALARLFDFARSLFPPKLDVLPSLFGAMLETIEIAFVGTVLGFVMSLPLAFLGTRTLFGPAVTAWVRLLVGGIRTVPSLLWAVVFVVGFGLGPAAGALGVAFYTIGYLSKLYYEAFEAVDAEVLEAVKSVGTNRLQLIVYAVIPEAANAIISQLLFMFEYNIRASSIMGFVGAGGIGFYLLGYLQMLQYRSLMTALLLTFVVVMTIDYLSVRLRSLILPSQQRVARVPVLAGIVPISS